MPFIDQPRLNQPAWFDLATTDLEASKAFYGELFGWTFSDGGPALGHYTRALRNGRAAAGLAPIQPGAHAMPTAWRVYFGVENAEATSQEILARGGQILLPTMDVLELGRMAIATDPEGAIFGLWQARSFIGAEIEGEPGGMCWAEVNTRTPTQTVAFYTGLFGLTAHPMANASREYFTLHGADDAAVAGVFQLTPDMAGIPAHWAPYFVVESLAHGDAVVVKHGGTLLHGPVPTPYGSLMIARDPQGGVFSYMSTR